MTTSDTPKQSTPPEILEHDIMSSLIPKSEREWWAQREIESLRAQLAQRDAALAVCAETLRLANYEENAELFAIAVETLGNLPESAKQVAKVLEAAKRVADGPFRQDYEELCQAMRDLDK